MFRIRVMISGDVQGVWFRVSAQDKANELGLTGWVKNLFSNAVEIIADGERDNLSTFTGWLQEGPKFCGRHPAYNRLAWAHNIRLRILRGGRCRCCHQMRQGDDLLPLREVCGLCE